jgi:hypothetical protein
VITADDDAELPAPTKSALRIWRSVALVVALQALILVLGIVLFSALSLANDGVGGRGGG